jgi:hypothetical protein
MTIETLNRCLEGEINISHDSTIYNIFRSAYFDRERACSPGGGAGGAAETLVPSRDRRYRPVIPSYDMNAAFMSFQQHERGIHAVWPGAGEVSVTKVRFRRVPRPTARREQTTINLSKAGIAL